MQSVLHALVGTVALVCVATFWLATVVAELFLGAAAIAAVKQAILSGLFLLIPAMMLTGASGMALARGRKARVLRVKQRRMAVAAGNGLLLLLPVAFYLNAKASAQDFDTGFYLVQALELLAGAIQFLLLARNFRDGLLLSGRLPRARVGASA